MVFSGIGNLLAPPIGNSLGEISPGLPFLFWAAMMLLGFAGLFLAREIRQKLCSPPVRESHPERISSMKINRIRIYQPKRLNPNFNQSDMVVTVETDAGITGIGEGGSRDTLTQCAGMLIGEQPERIQHLWQTMYRGFFYPAGREKLHALGALDLALWDIKGKQLGVPVYELLGGLTREPPGMLFHRFSLAGFACRYRPGLHRRPVFAPTAYPSAMPARAFSTPASRLKRPPPSAVRFAKPSPARVNGPSISTPAWTWRTPCGCAG